MLTARMRGEAEVRIASGLITSKGGRVLITTAKLAIKGPGRAASQVVCRRGRRGSSRAPVSAARRRLAAFPRCLLLAISRSLHLRGRRKDARGRGLENSLGHAPSREVSLRRVATLRRFLI